MDIGSGVGTGGSGMSQIVQLEKNYYYSDCCKHCEALLRKYSLISMRKIGESVLGKPIFALVLGHGTEHVHINAAVHANEWITTPLLLRFIEQVAEMVHEEKENSKEAREWLQKVTLWAVPMVNPDGVDLVQKGIPQPCSYGKQLLEWNNGLDDFTHWKANIRGIDLNDQFPAFWEEERSRRAIQEPAPQDYGGLKPLSEPEAAALANLTRDYQFARVLSLHSQGKEIYWNYREMEPANAEGIALRMANAGGYRAVKLSGSDAGYKDWFIYEFHRPGFTVEVGEGVNPLPPEQFDLIYEELAPILAQFMSE